MGTLVAFVALIAGLAVILAAVRRFPAVGRPVVWIGGALFAAVTFLCRFAARLADFILSPRKRNARVAAWKYVLWGLVGLLPALAFFGELVFPLSIPQALDPGYVLILGALLQLLVPAAAFFVVYEDFDVMDGIVPAPARRFARMPARAPVVAFGIVMFIGYAVSIAYWVVEVRGLPLLAARPETGMIAIDYLLVGLYALPSGQLLGLLDNLSGDSTAVSFAGTLIGQGYYFTIQAIGWLLLCGLASIAVLQQWQRHRIVTEITESDERYAFQIQRVKLAPPVVWRGVLRAALSNKSIHTQKRFILAAKEVGLFGLLDGFCRNVESYLPEVQVFGFEQCLEMFRQRSKEFRPEQCEAAMRAMARALRRGKLKVEPMKKMMRLMTSVAIVKKGVMKLPDKVRASMLASLKREFEKPRAREDAALRGFLRDLQTALGVSTAIDKVAALDPRDDFWVKRLSERRPAGNSANGTGKNSGNGYANGALHNNGEVAAEADEIVAEPVGAQRLLPPPAAAE